MPERRRTLNKFFTEICDRGQDQLLQQLPNSVNLDNKSNKTNIGLVRNESGQ